MRSLEFQQLDPFPTLLLAPPQMSATPAAEQVYGSLGDWPIAVLTTFWLSYLIDVDIHRTSFLWLDSLA